MRLYLPESQQTPPPWIHLVEGFGFESDRMSVSNRALILVKFKYYNASRYVAFVFGQGRHMLKPELIDRKFGLRAALNAMYKSGERGQDATRVQQVNAKTVAHTTIRVNRQANAIVEFEQFELDSERDLLSAVTGKPYDESRWGSRIRGSEAVTIYTDVELDGLGDLAKKLVRLGSRKDYQERFGWIDHVIAIKDPVCLNRLRAEVVSAVRSNSDKVNMAPPELIDWGDITSFGYRISSAGNILPPSGVQELNIERYLDILGRNRDRLRFKSMQRHHVVALDGQGQVAHEWPVARTLLAEIDLDSDTYLLEDGNFYRVSKNFMNNLDEYIDDIGDFSGKLPPASIGSNRDLEPEASYNKRAADGSTSRILLDRELIYMPHITGPIEICDVLTSSGEFIHIKRKLGSSALSHLFAQGIVSAELFLTNDKFRDKVREKIHDVADKCDDGDQFMRALDFEALEARNIKIVYAVIAKWNGRKTSEALPFFSKVNLRRTVRELRRLGFEVLFQPIDTESCVDEGE